MKTYENKNVYENIIYVDMSQISKFNDINKANYNNTIEYSVVLKNIFSEEELTEKY